MILDIRDRERERALLGEARLKQGMKAGRHAFSPSLSFCFLSWSGSERVKCKLDADHSPGIL